MVAFCMTVVRVMALSTVMLRRLTDLDDSSSF